MSRIRLNIDRVVLKGVEPGEGKAMVEALRAELTRVLSNGTLQTEGLRSYRTPVLKLGRKPLQPGVGGARKFGTGLAKTIQNGLKA